MVLEQTKVEQAVMTEHPVMTKQQQFEYCIKFLCDQGEPAEAYGACRYHFDNKKCAVGCFIDEATYDYIDSVMIGGIEGKIFIQVSKFLPHLDQGLMLSLQYLHDEVIAKPQWFKTSNEYVEAIEQKIRSIQEANKFQEISFNTIKFKNWFLRWQLED